MSPPAGGKSGLTKRQQAEKLRQALKLDYESQWKPHHRDIADYIQPRRPRFLVSDYQNAGTPKNEKIINNVATESSDTLRAGLVSGVVSAARPWFRLTTQEPGLAEDGEVKAWLFEAEQRLYGIIGKSNFYLRIEELFGDLGDFGIGPFHIEPDIDGDEVIRCFVHPVGSYYVAQNARFEIDTVFRDVPLTVKQLVKKFTYEKCCLQVRIAWDNGDIYKVFPVVHYIQPNEEYVEGALGWKGKKFASCWYEEARTPEEGFLHEGGFGYFPTPTPRWKVTGNDAYGTSPGMVALADVKGLQHLEEQKMGLVDKTVNPPMNVPHNLRGQQASLLPGAENPVGGTGGKLEPAVVIHPQAFQHILALIQEHEGRIRRSYHADLFRLLEAIDKGQMTAFEVRERIQEKMQLIGPAYERVEEELLDPAMDAIIHICLEAFMLPPVPEALAGAELKIEYTSIVAQALKASGIGAIRELLQMVGNLVAVDPDVLDNLDLDQIVRDYADKLGISPKLLREPEVVKAIRDAKAKAAAQAKAQQQAAMMAQGAKTLSETDTEGTNALTDIIGESGHGRLVG